jgi:hypothetical protein
MTQPTQATPTVLVTITDLFHLRMAAIFWLAENPDNPNATAVLASIKRVVELG